MDVRLMWSLFQYLAGKGIKLYFYYSSNKNKNSKTSTLSFTSGFWQKKDVLIVFCPVAAIVKKKKKEKSVIITPVCSYLTNLVDGSMKEHNLWLKFTQILWLPSFLFFSLPLSCWLSMAITDHNFTKVKEPRTMSTVYVLWPCNLNPIWIHHKQTH